MSGRHDIRQGGGLRIVVTGLMAQHPELGGMTWHYLQYLLGLARLGHDVYYIEDSGEHPYSLGNGVGEDFAAADCAANVVALDKTLSRFGFEDRWAYHCALESRWLGLPDGERNAVLKGADLLINVSGSLVEPQRYRDIARLAYIDTDPIVTQAKIASRPAFRRRVETHDVLFSFGETIGEADPSTTHVWHATRQPIALAEWEPVPDGGRAYTTVMNWTSYAPLSYQGRSLGQKDVEFRKFVGLPSAVGEHTLEVALGGTRHENWESENGGSSAEVESPRNTLRRAGWHVVAAYDVGNDLDRYRDYIRTSRGEWSVAKNAYVDGQPGWFSERSACYLAAGRPVIVQDTGFGAVLPTGEGLLSFRDLDGAVAAVAIVEADYDRHREAARAIAESHFDSDRVLSRLVARAMGDG